MRKKSADINPENSVAPQENSLHIPVLLQEVIALLSPNSNGVYVDGTLGGGGHTLAIAQKIQEDREIRENSKIDPPAKNMEKSGIIIAMDRDIDAINRSEKRLSKILSNKITSPDNNPNNPNNNTVNKTFPVRFAHANYQYLDEVLDLLQISQIDGFLLDLGLSGDQLADNERGFSFDSTGLLDLRFDTSEGKPAYELLEKLSEKEIADIIYQFGEERYGKRIARAIAERRKTGKPVRTACELAELVRRHVPREHRTRTKHHSQNIHPATRTFQALRIAVNDELGSLESVLKTAPNRLKPNGVIVVISFHSLEDRIVKNAFRNNPHWEIITPKPLTPSDNELKQNPRARSAKLRAARKQ
ncbi:MAG: 16S rRNA (cytosine(1402)-N(4))-methyltransferase RsmH [Planctomycetaceae bacterium]|jgi:16S rRNA (cytosine1402-N4)-methyltransferase|nr:16S rRNA (cytosine(1402)-N(4))-methyltransferase RsmH [Planctomycetaceae bacterium]